MKGIECRKERFTDEEYKDNDHQQIANGISKVCDQKWIITYDDVKPI
ncbi:MAG: hypothetical protein OIN86_11405 [Candidatus Methanoperedens sp.]|nr:hypothetical protein [Candidatus Methanoperedens sp.]